MSIGYLEHPAAARAILEIESGNPTSALELLRQVLNRRTPPIAGKPDTRPKHIVRLRAHIEQAIIELQHRQPSHALRTLRAGLAEKPNS